MALELPDGWKDQLPEEIKTSGVLDDIKTIDQMATMVVNGRKLQSNQISIPGEDVSPEKRDEFLKDLQSKIPDLVYVGEGADLGNIYDRMGRPKEATDYKLPDIPDPLKDNFATLSVKAHELGVTDKQLSGITDSILGDYNNSLNKQAVAKETSTSAMKKEYGEAFEDRKTSTANFAKQVGFDDGFVDAVKDGMIGLDNMKAFDKLMGGYESPGPKIGDELGQEFQHMTPGQAELKLDEIMNNKEHPYWDGANPAHDAAIAKVIELTRAADMGKEVTEADKFRDALAGRG